MERGENVIIINIGDVWRVRIIWVKNWIFGLDRESREDENKGNLRTHFATVFTMSLNFHLTKKKSENIEKKVKCRGKDVSIDL